MFKRAREAKAREVAYLKSAAAGYRTQATRIAKDKGGTEVRNRDGLWTFHRNSRQAASLQREVRKLEKLARDRQRSWW